MYASMPGAESSTHAAVMAGVGSKVSRSPQTKQGQRVQEHADVRASNKVQQMYEGQQYNTYLQHIRNPGLIQKRILQHGRPVFVLSD